MKPALLFCRECSNDVDSAPVDDVCPHCNKLGTIQPLFTRDDLVRVAFALSAESDANGICSPLRTLQEILGEKETPEHIADTLRRLDHLHGESLSRMRARGNARCVCNAPRFCGSGHCETCGCLPSALVDEMLREGEG